MAYTLKDMLKYNKEAIKREDRYYRRKAMSQQSKIQEATEAKWRELCLVRKPDGSRLLPGLQRKCPGVSFGRDQRAACCDGTGWQPIEYHLEILLTVWPGRWEGKSDSVLGDSWWVFQLRGNLGADESPIVAAYKALGLEESDASR